MKAPTPEAVAMRKLRARRRADRNLLQERLERSAIVRLVSRPGRSDSWEGKVQIGKVRHCTSRSTSKHGSERALAQVLLRMIPLLMEIYPPKAVRKRVAEITLSVSVSGNKKSEGKRHERV